MQIVRGEYERPLFGEAVERGLGRGIEEARQTKRQALLEKMQIARDRRLFAQRMKEHETNTYAQRIMFGDKYAASGMLLKQPAKTGDVPVFTAVHPTDASKTQRYYRNPAWLEPQAQDIPGIPGGKLVSFRDKMSIYTPPRAKGNYTVFQGQASGVETATIHVLDKSTGKTKNTGIPVPEYIRLRGQPAPKQSWDSFAEFQGYVDEWLQGQFVDPQKGTWEGLEAADLEEYRYISEGVHRYIVAQQKKDKDWWMKTPMEEILEYVSFLRERL